mmetsp:Transcript_4040/g.6055  ORF Transcript_4040/g.6055 Transcript_4040/m.6055 type:complete len:555 (-) Transcript_4040:26-1690(-)
MENWQNEIQIQIAQRNQLQVNFFEQLVNQHKESLLKISRLNRQNHAYEDKLRTLHSENEDLQGQLKHVREKILPGDISVATVQDLESNIELLKTELSETYQTIGEYNEDIRSLNQELSKHKNQLSETRDLLSKEKQCTQSLQADIQRLKEDKQTMEVTMNVMREELQAMQYKLVENQEQLTKTRRAHDELVQRWIKMKTAEAERMNETLNAHNTKIRQSKVEERVAAASRSMDPVADDLKKEGLLVGRKHNPSGLPKKAKKTFEAHRGEVNTLAYNSVGSLLATGSNDKTVKIWDTRSASCLSTLRGPVQSVMCVNFSSNDEYLLGASNDNSTRIWSIRGQTMSQKLTLTGHIGRVYSGQFTSDSMRVMTGSHDRTLKIWDLSRGYCIRTIFCFSSCNDIALSTDNMFIASGHADNSLRFWDVKSGECAQVLSTVHSRQVTSVVFSPDGNQVLTHSRDNTIKIVDTRKFRVLSKFSHRNFRSGLNWSTAGYSPDGRFVIAGSADGSVFIWCVESGKLMKRLTGGHEKTVSSAQWNPIGVQTASCDRAGIVTFWE